MAKEIEPATTPDTPANDRLHQAALDGADSMLCCYNATTWRLEDWDDVLQPPTPPAAPPQRK